MFSIYYMRNCRLIFQVLQTQGATANTYEGTQVINSFSLDSTFLNVFAIKICPPFKSEELLGIAFLYSFHSGISTVFFLHQPHSCIPLQILGGTSCNATDWYLQVQSMPYAKSHQSLSLHLRYGLSMFESPSHLWTTPLPQNSIIKLPFMQVMI